MAQNRNIELCVGLPLVDRAFLGVLMHTVGRRLPFVERLLSLVCLRTAFVYEPRWTTARISKEVRSIYHPRRIRTRPPPEPARIVPRPMVVKPRLVVALLSRVPVSLFRHLEPASCRAVRRRPVRVVLLVCDREPVLVAFEHRGVEMVPVLEPYPRHTHARRLLRIDGLRLDHRDPPRIVHHVQRLPLEPHAARIALPVDLVAAEVDPLLDE